MSRTVTVTEETVFWQAWSNINSMNTAKFDIVVE